MREEMDRKSFHTAIDTALSGLQENPYLYQRVIAQENGKEEGKVTVRNLTQLKQALREFLKGSKEGHHG